MRRVAVVILLACGLALCVAGRVLAGPFEDAMKAFESGDDETAVRLLKPLAERGDAEAQRNLGAMHDRGRGVPQDFAEAARWYRKAADQGNPGAQWRLGGLHEKGHGVARDPAEADRWRRKAAEQDRSCAYLLGSLYETGRGVPPDLAEAAGWYRRAAEKGHDGARLSLGRLYEEGRGVPRDEVLAHMWYDLAASPSPAPDPEVRELAAEKRGLLATRMTPAQIAEAQRLAREWKPKAGR